VNCFGFVMIMDSKENWNTW